MADLKIIARLNVENSVAPIKEDITKLNNILQADSNARIKIVAGLNIPKTIELINANLGTISKSARFAINNITFGAVNTAQLQNNLDRATAGVKANVNIAPVLDRKAFSDTESYIKEIVKQLSNPDIANNINFNTILNGLKEKFGLASKDIRTELSNFIQALKLTPNDKQAILDSYKNLMGAIENASGVAQGKNFTENISDAIYRLATTFPEVGNKAQQATQSMTEGLKQAEQAAENLEDDLLKISSGATANSNYIYKQNGSEILNNIRYLETEGNAIQQLSNQFKILDSDIKITTTEFARNDGSVIAFTANVKSADGAIEKFRYSLQDARSEAEKAQKDSTPNYKFVLQNITAADAGIQKLIETTQKWNDKTKATRTDMMATLKQIRTSWSDTNGGKSVEDSDNLQKLSAKYIEIVNKIKLLREANTTTFSSLKSDVTTAIKELNGMITSFHNAEKVATSLRTKGTEVVKQDTLNNLDKFENQIRNSKVPIEIFTNEIQRLRDVMVSLNDSNVTKAGVASGLTSVLDGLDNAKTKFQSLRELLRSFNSAGAADWLKTYKDQINSIADITIKGDGDKQIKVFDALNTKVSIYKKALTEIQQSWNPENNVQGIDAISAAFGRLIKEANLVQKNAQKNPQAFDNWVAKIEQTISGVDKLKKHLDEEVDIQRRIYDLQEQIARLSLNPDKNSSMLIYKQKELQLIQEELTGYQKTDNTFGKILSAAEQKKYVIQQTANEAKKLEEIQISISDKQAQIQAKAAEYSAKLNTRIVDEKQVEILNQLTNIERNRANIAKTTDEQLKTTYGSQISLSEKVIAKLQEELRAEGQLSTEFQNQINLRRQEIAEADRQRQNTAYQKQETAYLNEISELYKQISSGLKKISAEKSEANKQSIRDNELTNARQRIAEIQQEVEGNEKLSQVVAERIRYEKEQLVIQQQRITNSNAVKQAEQQAKAIHTYTTQIQNDLNQLNKMSANTVFTTNTSNPQVQAQKTAIQDLTKEYEKLKATLNGNISATDLDKVKTRLAELRVQLDNAKVGMNNLRTSMQSDKSVQKLAGDIAILTAQIKQFRSANSKSEARFGSEYDALLQKLKQNPDVSGLYAIRQQFRQLQGDVRAAGLTGTTFFDKLKADAMKFSAWFGVAAPGMLIAREIRQMFSSVVELDTAIVDLRKTFKGSTESLNEFYYSANDVARQLGVTTQAVIQSAADWSRLGYDTAESARNMAEAASIFSVISPGVDVSSATDGLVAVLQGFKELDDSNVIDDVLSKINIIGNNMPVSNADILEFLKRSSAAMSEAGNSLEEVISMGTAITSVTRDAAGAGTALKTNDCLCVQKCA